MEGGDEIQGPGVRGLESERENTEERMMVRTGRLASQLTTIYYFIPPCHGLLRAGEARERSMDSLPFPSVRLLHEKIIPVRPRCRKFAPPPEPADRITCRLREHNHISH